MQVLFLLICLIFPPIIPLFLLIELIFLVIEEKNEEK